LAADIWQDGESISVLENLPYHFKFQSHLSTVYCSLLLSSVLRGVLNILGHPSPFSVLILHGVVFSSFISFFFHSLFLSIYRIRLPFSFLPFFFHLFIILIRPSLRRCVYLSTPLDTFLFSAFSSLFCSLSLIFISYGPGFGYKNYMITAYFSLCFISLFHTFLFSVRLIYICYLIDWYTMPFLFPNSVTGPGLCVRVDVGVLVCIGIIGCAIWDEARVLTTSGYY